MAFKWIINSTNWTKKYSWNSFLRASGFGLQKLEFFYWFISKWLVMFPRLQCKFQPWLIIIDRSVGLSNCLSVRPSVQNNSNFWMDFNEIFRKCWYWNGVKIGRYCGLTIDLPDHVDQLATYTCFSFLNLLSISFFLIFIFTNMIKI